MVARLLAAAALAAALPAAERDLAPLVRAYADFMIGKGTDRYGPQHTPQFAGILFRKDPPELPPDAIYAPAGGPLDARMTLNLPNLYKSGNLAHKISYRGGDPQDDVELYQLLYHLTATTGDPRYARAADDSLRWFIRNAPVASTGMLPWGEHSGWDFRKEAHDSGYIYALTHEFQTRWPFFDKFFEFQPAPAPGGLTVLERFARAVWNGAVGQQDGKLAYCRHSHLTVNGRPREDELKVFGMFPRHGGYYIQLWSLTAAASRHEEFRREMLENLDRFIRALEEQAREHGYPIYRYGDREPTFAAGQLAGMARELEDAAPRVKQIDAGLSRRLAALAGRIDGALAARLNEQPPGAGELWQRWRAHPDGPHAAPFRDAFFREAARLAALDDLPDRELPAKTVYRSPAGRIPEQYADAIETLILAAESSPDRARYLDAARRLARRAITLFLDDGFPLPKCFDRTPRRMDGSAFPHYYHSYLGGDDLMWALARLDAASSKQK